MRLSGLLSIAGVISYMTHMATLSGGSGMGAHPVVLAYSEQVSFKLELTCRHCFDAKLGWVS